jgi:hypothetical protein
LEKYGYNKVISGPVQAPDRFFQRRRKKSGLIHAIGRRKSTKALLEHRIGEEGGFGEHPGKVNCGKIPGSRIAGDRELWGARGRKSGGRRSGIPDMTAIP